MYSFDVFDTLITRTVAAPSGIFALMKDRLKEEKDVNSLEDYVIDNFFELRIHSEELIRKSFSAQNIEEVELKDIYTAMAVCGCINEKQINYLCRLEQETEISNVLGIDENIWRVKNLLEQGERVILISDMYLPAETVREMLIQADPIFAGLPLYVSSEYKKRKTTGNLYRQVQEVEQIEYEEWTHIGDNLYQDIEIAYQLGIRVELSPRAELTAYEKNILKNYGNDSKLQLMIGTAARNEWKNIHKEKRTEKRKTEKVSKPYHIGCRYAAPVLYSYAEWIVDQAEKKNFKRLYFIARDGYLIKQIVDVILNCKKVNISTHYIYGSRRAWRMPSLSKEHYNLYQMILWSHINRINTLDELADVLHLPLQDLYLYLPGTFARNKEETHISSQELEYIARKLSTNEEFKSFHLQKLRSARELAQQYLIQEIDMTDDDFAFVDVAGGGLTQGCMRELIKSQYSKPIHTFFFKIDRVNLVQDSIVYTFMPGFLANNIVIEMLCRAPHGQTEEYIRKNRKIVPVLGNTESRLLKEHGFYEYEKGIIDFSKAMCKVSLMCGKKVGSMHNILLYLKYIAEEPSEEVLEYFASMPSSESGRGAENVEYAPRLSEHDIKEIFLKCMNEPVELFYKGTNLNYSIMRATSEERAFIDRCRREYGSAIGMLSRQEKEREIRKKQKCFHRAAFYPVRLLEEKLVLYGAGKFGQELYNRLIKDPEHEIVLWVDKKADVCQRQGLTDVHFVDMIIKASYDQIVVAVMSKEMAEGIRTELVQMGIKEEKIVWFSPYGYSNARDAWETEEIG